MKNSSNMMNATEYHAIGDKIKVKVSYKLSTAMGQKE
jgi:hypothetical protein